MDSQYQTVLWHFSVVEFSILYIAVSAPDHGDASWIVLLLAAAAAAAPAFSCVLLISIMATDRCLAAGIFSGAALR